MTAVVGVAERLNRWALERPDDTALIFLADGETETERWSFAELHGRAMAVARRVIAEGGAGHTAVLLYPQGLDFCAALLGCFYAGAVAAPAPFNARNQITERVGAIIADAGPALILTRDAVVVDAHAGEPTPWLATSALGVDAGPPLGPPAPGAVAFLQYTSGSTGNPKGVMVDHANLAANVESLRQAFGVDEQACLVSWLPLFHDMGLVGKLLLAVDSGRPCVLMPPLAFLQSPGRWLKAISRYGGTVSGAPNFAYELCVRRLAGKSLGLLDLSRWRAAYCGAEPVRASTMAGFAEMFAPHGFSAEALTPCYGLAEATLVVSSVPLGQGAHADASGRVSCGPPVGCEVAIVDAANGQPVDAGQVGEIWVRGASVARGYWRNPEATAQAFGAVIPGLGGDFLKTGDRGCLADGALHLSGRSKDSLIHRGANIDPDDVERAAAVCAPAFAAVGAAFAIDRQDEEVVVLVQEVERRFLPLEAPERLIDAAVEAVAAKTGLRLYDLVLVRPGAVPRTTSGKVQRGLCRDLYLAGGLALAAVVKSHPLLTREAHA
jgi:acyl-CoA synthetase (AMP-forming)/AMP-acid ligase II